MFDVVFPDLVPESSWEDENLSFCLTYWHCGHPKTKLCKQSWKQGSVGTAWRRTDSAAKQMLVQLLSFSGRVLRSCLSICWGWRAQENSVFERKQTSNLRVGFFFQKVELKNTFKNPFLENVVTGQPLSAFQKIREASQEATDI